MKPLLSILILAFLMLSAACSQNPVVRVESVPVLPPETMISPVSEPQFSGTTNEDHLHYTLELRGALRECNANLESLRQWREDQQ